jgi:hypothetical protein
MDIDGLKISSGRSPLGSLVSAGRGGRRPNRLRSFSPDRVAGLECDAWVAYYQRRWLKFLTAAVGMVRAGFGMSWPRTTLAAWYVLRANQLWAPAPVNDPERARRCMQRFYALLRATYGEPQDPAESARLEVEWWRAHRSGQPAAPAARDELVDALVRLYAFVFGVAESDVRPAAVHRSQAMEVSDQWVAQGRRPGSPLLALERAALVRSYEALLVAVHRGTGGQSAAARSDGTDRSDVGPPR